MTFYLNTKCSNHKEPAKEPSFNIFKGWELKLWLLERSLEEAQD